MMKLGFMTLGCPEWDLDTICRNARAYGFNGVDFRGMRGEIDITVMPDFTKRREESLRKLQDAGLEVCGISSSISLCREDMREKNLEEARRTIELAHFLGARNARVFGNGDPKERAYYELADEGARAMEAILALDGAAGLFWSLETHDQWVRSCHCRLLLERVPAKPFGILWDMAHTARLGGESPAEIWEALGERIRYVHVKDARRDPAHPSAMNDGWRYTPPGQGELPVRESIELLLANDYDGWFVLEHEKRWHPALEEPEEIFPVFVNWMRENFSGKAAG